MVNPGEHARPDADHDDNVSQSRQRFKGGPADGSAVIDGSELDVVYHRVDALSGSDVENVSFGPKHRDETEMDMTPMVDVTFLLLIFFMVTAAFSLQRSMRVPTPRPEQPSTNVQQVTEDADTVTVHVDEFNTYRVVTSDWDVEAPSDQELLIKLREARQGNSQGIRPTTLRVMANVEALHRNVIRAMDAGSSVGMEQVQLQIVEENE
ncbi:MAG: biopolymer transporter ExbD [Planctomycetes bacterium]|nr:biopolymer transporter ExbD [Planctomycetota bacterium]